LNLKEISLETLKEIKKVHPSGDGLRVLGNGELKSALTVKAAYVSPSAKSKIEAAGGKVELV
jgi:large subunit ribosomal protein L15